MISFERLKEILECFSKVKIAVVGDMMLDEYLIGKVTRISPEAPVPVVNIEQERFVLGGASNVANNLKSLSAQVSVYGVVGQDSNGEKFVKELEAKQINCHRWNKTYNNKKQSPFSRSAVIEAGLGKGYRYY